jgi:hypothetical protein
MKHKVIPVLVVSRPGWRQPAGAFLLHLIANPELSIEVAVCHISSHKKPASWPVSLLAPQQVSRYTTR